jgi:protein-S-isoprenylcysteine O-methyltransferase Ste14
MKLDGQRIFGLVILLLGIIAVVIGINYIISDLANWFFYLFGIILVVITFVVVLWTEIARGKECQKK